MSKPEEGRPDLNRREKHGMEIILACASEMHKCDAVLKDRLTANDRRGYAYFKSALGLLDKALGLIYKTVPFRQLEQVEAICKKGYVQISMPSVIDIPGYTPIKDSDVNTIVGAAVNNKCAICVNDGQECTKCELRKTLMCIWPPKELPRYGGCPYQGVRWRESVYEPEGEEG